VIIKNRSMLHGLTEAFVENKGHAGSLSVHTGGVRTGGRRKFFTRERKRQERTTSTVVTTTEKVLRGVKKGELRREKRGRSYSVKERKAKKKQSTPQQGGGGPWKADYR